MGIIKALLFNVPLVFGDYHHESETIKRIARSVTGARDDGEAERLIESDPALQVEFQHAVMTHSMEMAQALVFRAAAADIQVKKRTPPRKRQQA